MRNLEKVKKERGNQQSLVAYKCRIREKKGEETMQYKNVLISPQPQ